MKLQSVMVTFNDPGRVYNKQYEYLIPEELYNVVNIGDRVIVAGASRPTVTRKLEVATSNAKVPIKGLMLGEKICEDYAPRVKEELKRYELYAKRKELMEEMERIESAIQALRV